MWQIFIGSLILSLIHASIPNHWLPLIAIGKSEKWARKEIFLATIITGFAHTFSTVLIGIMVGFIGLKLSNIYKSISNVIAPSILVIIGLVYLGIDFVSSYHHHYNEHSHSDIEGVDTKKRSKFAILISLSVAMFLTPCVELEAYYFQAGTFGWTGIFIVSTVYTFTTIALMLIFVYFGMIGTNRFKFHYLEHHEKQITGFVLVILGLMAFFVRF